MTKITNPIFHLDIGSQMQSPRPESASEISGDSELKCCEKYVCSLIVATSIKSDKCMGS